MLERYGVLLTKWTARINLVSRGTLQDLRHRHIADCLQVAALGPLDGRWADLGSGAGLPGAIVAIVMAGEGHDGRVTCIESDQRKCAFLRTVARELSLPMDVVAARSEAADPVGAGVVTARAFTGLADLLGHAERHLAEDGVGLFPKGKTWRSELEAARGAWHFSCDARPSVTEPEAVILKIGDLARA